MTEKRLTEERRLAKEILPKVQKMQRDMFFNNHVCVCIDFNSISYSFVIIISCISSNKSSNKK